MNAQATPFATPCAPAHGHESNTFNVSDFDSDVRELLAKYRSELKDFDDRPPQYKPRQQITATGAALLLHCEIERLNAARYRSDHDFDLDVDALDVDGGDA